MFQHRQNSLATLAIAAVGVFSLSAIAQPSLAQSASVMEQSAPAVVAAATIPGASAGIARVTSSQETRHLVVGHSLFFDTANLRLHRVYAVDPTVLNSVTLGPTQIVVTAMAPGVSSLILQYEDGRTQSFFVSSDLDVQELRTALSEAMQDNTVNVEGSGNRIILSGQVKTQALADTAVKLATLYTKDVANSLAVVPDHPRQVSLKVRILEVDRNKANQFGINLFNPGGNTSFLASATTGQFPSTSTLTSPTTNGVIGTLATSSPLNFLLYSSKLNLGATIQDLESKQVLQILAEPTLTVISGEKGNFLSGGEFPFPVIQPGGTGGASSVSITFKPYGVKLEFAPVVNDDGTIRLHVAPEVSALDYTNAVTISGYTVPALSTRKADTEVVLRDNQSYAISGLLDQRTTDLLSKTPGIASIPILGALFKSKNVSRSTTELVVIITPTLVDPLTETGEPRQPGLPIPTLNENKFDNSLGKDRNPHPAAPPIEPTKPASSIQAAPTSTEAASSQTPVMVQVMTLSHKEDADAMVAALKRHGYDVAITQYPTDALIHLEVGPFPNKPEAETMRQKLVSDGYNATLK